MNSQNVLGIITPISEVEIEIHVASHYASIPKTKLDCFFYSFKVSIPMFINHRFRHLQSTQITDIQKTQILLRNWPPLSRLENRTKCV